MESKNRKDPVAAPTADGHEEYDAPAVERVMSAEDLAREIHYAGIQTISNGAVG